MPYQAASAIEIDKKLRDDFRRRLKDFGISVELTDPVLAVLFRTFAQQIETLYNDTDRIRLALLDELIAGIGIEPRLARPAQTVVRFAGVQDALTVAAGTEMIGAAETGERFVFSTDVPITTSDARIAFAFAYQNGMLQLLSGVEMPEHLSTLRPSFDPARADLGPNPALFFAIERLPASHLGHHAIFLELGPGTHSLSRALRSETWTLFGAEGDLRGRGILRPHAVNAGVNKLEWLVGGTVFDDGAAGTAAETPRLPDGFYGPRLFVFPHMPPDRRLVCRVPRGMDSAFARIFGREVARAQSEPRAWIRVSLPRDVPPLVTSVGGIVLHAMTASNVECLNQTVYFGRHGTSIPVARAEGGAAPHLVAPLSIVGENGSDYIPAMEPASDSAVGRFAVRNGVVELQPAVRIDGVPESYANLRVWVTAGAAANAVRPGQVTAFLKPSLSPTLRVSNPTAAAGGADAETSATAERRFAQALLSRDRVVTTGDLVAAVRAFDSRIRDASVTSSVARGDAGVHRIERVAVHLDASAFVDPHTEVAILENELLTFLEQRVASGTNISVSVAAS